MFLVALADMGETRRCRIKWDTGLEVRIPGIKHAQTHFVDRNLSFCPPFYISREFFFSWDIFFTCFFPTRTNFPRIKKNNWYGARRIDRTPSVAPGSDTKQPYQSHLSSLSGREQCVYDNMSDYK